jgi:mediator of replication checkpoint protein 1
MVPGTSDGLSEDHELEAQIFDLEAVYDEDKVEKLAKQRRLEQTKRAVAQAQAARNKAKQPILNGNESDSDLDFEVLPDPVKSVAATSTTASSKLSERRRGPDAKAVLRRDNTVSAISKQRQDQLRLAGRSARHKDDDASETFVAFAARTFNHADLKRANGGAKPAERKAGRDRPVDAKSLDAMMKASHLRQVAAVQKKKEEDWGRARALPQRQEQDVEKLLDMTAKADARDAEDEENEEDEDGDYDPEDEDSADEVVQFSGEEDEEGAEVAGESEGDDGGSDVENDLEMSEGDKENVPLSSAPKQIGEDEDEDDEPVPLKVVRKARASNRAIVDSDDEEVTPRRPTEPRQPLSEVSAPARVDATPKGIEPTFVDLAGFGHGSGGGSGSGSGSPGFSQLFEATQAMGLMSGAAVSERIRPQE